MNQEHHTKGSLRGTLYLGLRTHEGALLAVMVVRPDHDQWRIARYAAQCDPADAFGALTRDLSARVAQGGGGTLVGNSDTETLEGELFDSAGFTQTRNIPVDYSYAVVKSGAGLIRESREKYRISRFRRDPSLFFADELAEHELARRNGMYRVWDSGKVRWELTIPPRP